MSKSQTKTDSSITPPKEVSKSLMKKAGQSYVFSWSWFLGGVIVLTLLCLSAYGMRTLNMFNMSQQVIDIADGLKEEGNLRGAIDVLTSFLESSPNSPTVWKRQCDLWSELYQSQSMTSRDMLLKALERHKRALPFLRDDSIKEIRERILEMELEMAQSDDLYWADTLTSAREILQTWKNHPLGTKVLAIGSSRQFITVRIRPIIGDFQSLDQLFQVAWELNRGDIDLAMSYADFLRKVEQNWQGVVSPQLLVRSETDRNLHADEIISTMVQENPEDVRAYLARYEYRRENKLLDFSQTGLNSDLVKALEYYPNSALALRLAGLHMFICSQSARGAGNYQEADVSRDLAHDYFTQAISAAPSNPDGYLLLGRWFMASNQVDKALETWNLGRRRIGSISPDIVGEVAFVSINQKLYEQAWEAIAELERFVINVGPRLRNTQSLGYRQMYGLLLGKYYLSQRDDALAQAAEANRKITEAQARGLPIDPDLLKLADDSNSAANGLRNLAINEIRAVLDTSSNLDYDRSGGTTLSRLQGEGFISLGRLEAEFQAWDKAVDAYQKARTYPLVAPLATIQAANAYERANQFEASLAVLQEGARRYPENPALRFFYLNALFAQELARPVPTSRNYALLEQELNEVALLQDKLPQAWRVDTMRVQLHYVRGGGTRQAQQECLVRLRELEVNTKYAGDPVFLAEIATQYSSIGAFDDFNRVINLIRDMPGGDARYYVLRIEDAKRRGDTSSALFLADEALSFASETDKPKFARIRQALESPGGLNYLDADEQYGRLKNLYDGKKIHDPQTFFELANLAFSRDELEIAKNIEDRLRQIEGEQSGTLWRYLAVKRLIRQAAGDPTSDFLNNARAVQKEITGMRPNWDMTYVLLAEIEKEAGNINEAIASYLMAVSRGNRQPAVYREVISLLYRVGRDEEAVRLRRSAGTIFGSAFFDNENIFPPLYQGYYEQIYRAIQEGNIGSADDLANACIKRAIDNKEPTDLLLDLNTRIGKLFMDSSNEVSAERFFRTVADQGGKYVIPLAVCYIKMGKTDEAFGLFIRELEKSTVDTSILEVLFRLSRQTKPSEAVLQKIDQQLERLEPLFTEKMESLILLAGYWINRNRLDHVIPIYRKGLEMEPGNLWILNNLAMSLAESARGGESSTIARGEFRANETKRITLTTSQPRSTYIIRFPGQTPPKPEDFRFLTTPRE